MDLETSRGWGGVGALLVVVGCLLFFWNAVANYRFPSFGLIGGSDPGGPTPAWFAGAGLAVFLTLAGLIVLLIVLRSFANNYKNAGIFSNALYGVVASMIGVGVLIAAVEVIGQVTLSLNRSGLDLTDLAIWQQLLMTYGPFVLPSVSFVIAFMFIRRSLSILATKTGVRMFEVAALIMVIGAILTVIMYGVILILVGFLFLGAAFFSIRTTTPQQPAITPSTQ